MTEIEVASSSPARGTLRENVVNDFETDLGPFSKTGTMMDTHFSRYPVLSCVAMPPNEGVALTYLHGRRSRVR